jgi:competence protein ComEA
MSAIPTRRLLIYAAAGVLVLVVGTVGLLAMRSPVDTGETDAVVLDVSGLDVDAVGDVDLPAGPNTTLPPTTTVTEAPIFVQVAGAVRRPGVYQVAPDARVFQAVLQAGGFTEAADQDAVPLAARLSDGCRLYVPKRGETAAGQVLSNDPLSASAGESPSSGPVSLNSATLEELDALPGIGPALAQQIITYRETQGPFTSVDQLTDVPGIGPSKLEQLRPLVAP